MIDWTDSQAVNKFAHESIEIANAYLESRKSFATNKRMLHVGLAKAYKDRAIDQKISMDKALVILSTKSDQYMDAYQDYLFEEHNYKGLEKVDSARQSYVSLIQSLIKNRISNS